MMGMTFIDFFAGIGGFRRGMELAGHKCVGFCEYDKYAVASYTSMHLITEAQRDNLLNMDLKQRQKKIMMEEYRNGEWYANDIRTVEARSLPHADCWCFGFPCQDISIAGKQLGFAGRRSSLFFAVTGLIKDLEEKNRPRVLFIENVKNLLSVNRGLDFAKLLIELDEVGYDAEWSLLNSRNFGVPQNRERVFIIGHLRGSSGRKIFPVGETDSIHNAAEENGEVHETAQCLTAGGNDKWQGDYIIKQIGNCMPTSTRKNPNQGRIYDPDGIAPCLSKMDGGGREPMIPVSMTQKACKQSDVSPTLTARGPSRGRGNYSPVPGVAMPVSTPGRMHKNQNGRRMKESGEDMFTLTAQEPHGVMLSGIYTNASKEYSRPPLENLSRCLKAEKHDAGIYDGMRIRRLTPRECFRLQGWTDDYYDRAAMVNSDSQLYKQAGNGVTVPVIEVIAKRLI